MTRRSEVVVAIRASSRVRELRVEHGPPVRITTTGRGRVTTRRIGIPPTGAEPGMTYCDVELAVGIVSRPPEDEADEAGRCEPRAP